jgi:N-acetylglucosaminyldiphosphoundecaprenol N-acetyl-beta-D-mannosaminyltransferase
VTVVFRSSRRSPTPALGVPATVRPSLPRTWVVFQRAAALGALVAASPLLGAVYVAVRATSRGPFLFRQRRPGLEGEIFEILKIRTMASDAEGETALGVGRGDARVTAVGHVLRELKLDELPQLWNVVRGDMRVVGPRPLPMPLYDELCELVPGFEARTQVPPGLTNLGQVSIDDNQVGDNLAGDWAVRFEAELHYIQNRSVPYELLLIALTVLFVLRRLGRSLKSRLLPTKPRLRLLPDLKAEVPSTLILGIPIAKLDYAGVLGRISSWIARGEDRYVGVCPVHSIVDSLWNPDHRAALQGSHLNTADGVPVAWSQRLLGYENASRVYGPELFLRGLALAEERGWRVAFYGGSPERLAKLLETLAVRFPRLQVAAAISPPYRPLTPEEDAEFTARLRRSRPDMTWVGIGSPKQEIWMRSHCGRVPGVLLGVGAAFDFVCGAVPQAPPILQRLGLEWLFRVGAEPRRLFKRYAKANPTYLYMMGAQLIRHRLLGEDSDFEPVESGADRARRAAERAA